MILKVTHLHLEGIIRSAQIPALQLYILWKMYTHGPEKYVYTRSAKLIRPSTSGFKLFKNDEV